MSEISAAGIKSGIRKVPTWVWIGVGGGALIGVLYVLSNRNGSGGGNPAGIDVADPSGMFGALESAIGERIDKLGETYATTNQSNLDALKATFTDGLASLKDEFGAAMGTEIADLSSALGTQITDLGTSISGQIGGLDTAIAQLGSGLATQIGGLGTQIGDLARVYTEGRDQLLAVLGNVTNSLGSITLAQQQLQSSMAAMRADMASVLASTQLPAIDWSRIFQLKQYLYGAGFRAPGTTGAPDWTIGMSTWIKNLREWAPQFNVVSTQKLSDLFYSLYVIPITQGKTASFTDRELAEKLNTLLPSNLQGTV